jgi:hypothetical protein
MDNMETTNLEKVKEIIKTFANMRPIPKNEIFVQHTFLDTRFVYNENKELVDVFAKKEHFEHYKKVLHRNIDKSPDVMRLFLHITKPYKMLCFKYVCDYLSEQDYGELLKNCWTMEEFTSKNPDVSKKEMVSFFKRAKKEYIMDEEELKVYNNLPEQVTIYRGVRDKRWLRELSWTLDYEQAEWFATRFESEEQIVYEVTLPKQEVLAFINDRDEQEIIIDPYNLKKYEIKEMVL